MPEPLVIEKLCDAAQDERNHRHSVSSGIRNLRREVALRCVRCHGVKFDPDTEVIAGMGSKGLFSHVCLALLGTGGTGGASSGTAGLSGGRGGDGDDGQGGGLYTEEGTTITLSNSTLSGNVAGGGNDGQGSAGGSGAVAPSRAPTATAATAPTARAAACSTS